MSSKTLIVYESQILFEILDEIKEFLNLEILNVTKKNIESIKLEKMENYVIISLEKHKNLENCLVISDLPKKLFPLLEYINVGLLKNKYFNQSELKIGKYVLNLNSRIINFENQSLSLTEKETELLIYINSKKFVSLKELQNNVWRYSSNLETHTVETHIYRLRKKILNTFNDNLFIVSKKNGYQIK